MAVALFAVTTGFVVLLPPSCSSSRIVDPPAAKVLAKPTVRVPLPLLVPDVVTS